MYDVIIPVDVLIIGAGPAGISTALHLLQAEPAYAERMIVLEKAVHPRPKICGGGITRLGEEILTGLGLTCEPPHVPVQEVRLTYQQHVFVLRDTPIFRVVERAAFDYWLAGKAVAHGLRMRQGEAVQQVIPQHDDVMVVTPLATYRARVVIAADGANSQVRRCLHWEAAGHKARLLEVVTPMTADRPAVLPAGCAAFDFSRMADGLQGYCWDFPTLVQGQPAFNSGIFDSRIHPNAPRIALQAAFQAHLAQAGRSGDPSAFRAFPLRWLDPHAALARPRVLLAGDAAGSDPLCGEGIAFALAYGQVAAEAVCAAFRQRNFEFTDYQARLFAHPLIRQLRARTMVARSLYRLPRHPYLRAWFWETLPLLFHAAAWYRPAYLPITPPTLKRLRVLAGN